MLSLFNFSSIFPEGAAADPICPYVRTPMSTNERDSGGLFMYRRAPDWCAGVEGCPMDDICASRRRSSGRANQVSLSTCTLNSRRNHG